MFVQTSVRQATLIWAWGTNQVRAITCTGLLAIAAVLLLTTSKLWLGSAVAQPEIPPATKGEQCVAETDFMRKNHMKMLNHQRDETVIDGVRGNPYSLVGCVDCHAQRDAGNKPVRIDAEGQFCETCHAFAAVKIDCFSCHAAIPDDSSELIGHLDTHPDRYQYNASQKEKRSLISASSYATQELLSLSLHLSDHRELLSHE